METLDLNDLREFALPASPSWWPLAPGLIFVLILVVWILLCVAWLVFQKRKQSAYRRAGVALLKEAESVRAISVVLKRVAIVSFGREAVAALYGEEWVHYLEERCAGVQLQPLAQSSDEAVDADLRMQATKWIKEHRC